MNIGIGESIVYSIVGLVVVFVALTTLAVAIILCTRLFSLLGLTEEKAKNQPKEDVNEEYCAVIMSAISEELKRKRMNYKIKSITEIK